LPITCERKLLGFIDGYFEIPVSGLFLDQEIQISRLNSSVGSQEYFVILRSTVSSLIKRFLGQG
jgi:hypothetical protein